jgi:hypothetical protein
MPLKKFGINATLGSYAIEPIWRGIAPQKEQNAAPFLLKVFLNQAFEFFNAGKFSCST